MKALFAALSLMLLTSVPAHGQDLRTVRVGVTNLTTDIAFYLAEKRGYFKQEGITVETIKFDSGAKMIAPLGTGQLDVGGGATSAGLYNAIERGVELRIVADKGTNKAGYDYKALLVRKDLVDSGAVKTLADLKGKKIAVVAKGAADESVLNQALAKAGLAASDVNKVYLGFGQHAVAFENGAIDAAISGEPGITRMLRSGKAVRFAGVSEFYPVQQTAVVLYGKQFSENRELGTRFIKAYLRGARDYDRTLKNGKLSGPGASVMVKALSDMTGIKDMSIFTDAVAPYIDPQGTLNLESLQTDLDYFKAAGLVKPDTTLKGVVDTSFVDAAVRVLGPVPSR